MGGVALFITTFVRASEAFHAHYATTRFQRCGFPHLKYIRHLLAYFVNTRTLGLTYRRSDKFNVTGAFFPGESARDERLHGIGDASYTFPRSVGGSLVMLGGAAVMWRVNVHRAPSISPGEAEFYALTNTITETVTIRQLIEELGVVFASATQVFSDSHTARTLAEPGATTHRTRFIHRRWHFAKCYEQVGVIKISPIRGAVNPTNVLTKFTFGCAACASVRFCGRALPTFPCGR